MNFPYDYSIVPLIMAYVQADAYDKAKPHLEILADQTFDWLKFYYSLSVKELESGYSQDFAMTDRTREDLITIAKEAKTLLLPMNSPNALRLMPKTLHNDHCHR